jgi:hypothetical protein
VEVSDGDGAVLAVCKSVHFTERKNSLTVTSPNHQTVCPMFNCYGTSSSPSPINTAGCLVGGGPATVTLVDQPDQDGAWIVQFSGVALTAPNSTTVTVAQQDGTGGSSSGVVVFNCVPPPVGP